MDWLDNGMYKQCFHVNPFNGSPTVPQNLLITKVHTARRSYVYLIINLMNEAFIFMTKEGIKRGLIEGVEVGKDKRSCLGRRRL